jgi:K+/H+ antiporter YhaU regulatory subunit KhtT
MDVKESTLPEIGTKYQFDTRTGTVFVICKFDGNKQIYFEDKGGRQAVISLEESDAKMLGAILLDIYTNNLKNKINVRAPNNNEIDKISREIVGCIGIIRDKKYLTQENIKIEKEDLIIIKE